jgi:hypothetical protein
VIVLLLAAALAAAVSVTLCGVPGVIVDDAGAAVTPDGNPLSTILTPALNPLIAVTEIAVPAPAAPPVMLTVAGLTPSEKSAGAAVTLNAKLAVCVSAPETPVTVTVLELAAALAADVSVNVPAAPVVILNDAGDAVTPAGNPDSVTVTVELNPLIAVTVTVTGCVAPPAVSATDGPTERLKSRTTELPPHPTAPSTIPLSTSSRQPTIIP